MTKQSWLERLRARLSGRGSEAAALSCREFVDFLMQYLDRELSDAERRVFEQHMEDCPPCKVYLDSYEDTVKMGQAVCRGGDELPDDVPEDLVQAILAARPR
ncbi:MAG: anti-sigma factor [Proteobacteria bacterium]|nr:anti-sigma factor [Pseudomonadota bacterium]